MKSITDYLQQKTFSPIPMGPDRLHIIKPYIYIASHHSAAEHRASTRIPHLILFLASVLFSAQVLLTPVASSSTVLHHVLLGLPLRRLPWGFHSRACLAMSSGGFRSLWPSHPHLRFLICKSILGCFMHFHSSLFVTWSSQKILNKRLAAWL